MSYIEDCSNFFRDSFSEGWIPDSDNENAVKEAFEKIKVSDIECFKYLTKSILSGEYINVSDFDGILDGFIDSGLTELNPGQDQYANIVSTYKDFCDTLRAALKLYRHFISLAGNKFQIGKDPNRMEFVRVERSQNRHGALVDFYELVIPLCLYDYQLPINSEDFMAFHILRIRLASGLKECVEDLKPIYLLLLQRSNFIICRIKDKPYSYRANFAFEKIIPSNLDLGDYKNLLPIDVMPTEKELRDRVDGADVTLKDFVFLMRFYKKTLKSTDDVGKMDAVIDQFVVHRDSMLNEMNFYNQHSLKYEYDRFSVDTVLNYLHNCRFSFISKKADISIDEIKKQLRVIDNIQGSTNILNYHPYGKAIEAVLRLIQNNSVGSNYNETILQDAFSFMDELLNKYKECLEWGRIHKFYPFQLPYAESLFYSECYGMNLFVPSAYAKHVDYPEREERLNEYKREVADFKSKSSLERERIEIEKLREEIKNTDKKAFDLLALFTATLTFLFGIVNVYTSSNVGSLEQLVSKTTGLGFMLLLFMGLYLLVSPQVVQRISWKDYLKTIRFRVGAFLVIVYVLAVVYLTYHSSTDNSVDKDKKPPIENTMIE